MIKISIDVKKINKDRLFKGEKGLYLNAVLIETPDSDYGSHMIVEEVSKEERANGIKGAILGNAKTFEKRSGGQSRSNTAPAREETQPEADDDIPF